MGLTNLWLVNPLVKPDSQAIALAAGASDVIGNAHIVDTLDEALAGCDVSTSTIRIFCSIVFLHLKIIRASYHKTKTDADLAAILCAVFPFFNIQ